jgi:phage tail sheath protein FI
MPFVRPVLSAPGVYVQEVPSGVHPITGVATSITVFLGRAAWGPVNEAVYVYSWDEFQSTFGGLRSELPMTYAVQDFFANGGSTAIVIRLFRLPDASQDPSDVTAPIQPAAVAGQPSDALKKAQDDLAGAVKTMAAKKAALEKATAAVNDAKDDATKKTAQDALTKARADLAAATKDTNDKQTALGAVKDAPLTLNLVASSPGKWGNRLSYATDKRGINAGVIGRYATLDWDATDLFNLTVTLDLGGNDKRGETFTNVSINEQAGARSLARILERSSAYARLSDEPGTGSGTDSSPLQAGDYEPGLALLPKLDLFNLVVIPPDVRGGDTPPTVYTSALERCAAGRATLIVDPPSIWGPDVSKIQPDSFANDIGVNPGDEKARYAAIYFPRVKKPDPLLDGALDVFTPSGIIAGILARTDASRGVWKAPAGTEAGLTGVADVAQKLIDQENGQLNVQGVNCLRTFPSTGPIIWGARTLRGSDQLADDYKYLPVRRLADYIEQTLLRATQWAVFEPNDEPLWSQLRSSIGTFMADLFRQGAFQGASRDEAYFVKCDASTTMQSDIDLGIVNVVIGFAPLKPAEFVVLYIQQKANQGQA